MRWPIFLLCFLYFLISRQSTSAQATDVSSSGSSESVTFTSKYAMDVGDKDDGSDDATQTALQRTTAAATTIPTHPITPQHISFSSTRSDTFTQPFITHHSIPPPPSSTPGFATPQSRPSGTRHRQSTIAIVFEVLAGVAGIGIILGLLRCGYSWNRTPSRDRIASLLSRHQLEREMEEIERQQIEQRRPRTRAPPPPYQPAPAYDSVVASGEVA
ncbi:hypothetical protein A0H81_03886 [Grifola frondosa]|uniref:Transmembrane protein n=1 Tax=Grifola frondosa TaxID=5627 RepID=A0A1C7MGT7_GRIFR|nr:hypothetical protein A0H81_03886 [Grifola frondosa]